MAHKEIVNTLNTEIYLKKTQQTHDCVSPTVNPYYINKEFPFYLF